MEDSSESFYVWVSSKFENPSGAKNRPEDFTVNLQHNEQLRGKWEVALVEIDFPNSWYNLRTAATIYTNIFQQIPYIGVNNPIEVLLNNERDVTTVRAGVYHSLANVLAYLSSRSQYLRFTHNKFSNKVTIDIKKKEQEDRVPRISVDQGGLDLFQMLGINASDVNLPHTFDREWEYPLFELPMRSSTAPSLELFFPALFIYCNFIDTQYVGNERKPLLQFVPIPRVRRGVKQVHREFRNRIYCPVSVGYINSLSFKICDDSDVPVTFREGFVRAYLHFRPKREQ